MSDLDRRKKMKYVEIYDTFGRIHNKLHWLEEDLKDLSKLINTKTLKDSISGKIRVIAKMKDSMNNHSNDWSKKFPPEYREYYEEVTFGKEVVRQHKQSIRKI